MTELFWAITAGFLAIAVIAAAGKKRLLTFAWFLLALACFLNAGLGLHVLISGRALNLGVGGQFWPLGQWSWILDSLGAFFLVLLNVLGLAVAIYSGGRTRQGLAGTGVWALILVSGQFFFTNMLLAAQNALALLIAWEGMSLLAFGFILSDHTRRHVRRAAYMTIVISEIGFLALVIALLLPAGQHLALDFPTLAATLHTAPAGVRLAVFWLTFLGFGVKSGILPVQLWLPRAYTVVPANLGALLAGGLVNLGIFGILRVYFSWLGGSGDGTALLLLLLGGVGVFLGAFYAATVRDVRRILGYSSIENIGFMVVDLGLAMLFFNHGQVSYAGLALVALFIQIISHSLAKALSFLDSSEVAAAGGSNLDLLGGLHRQIPTASNTFLIAALSLAAVAPFSGFTAEWLSLQSLLQIYHGWPTFLRLSGALVLILLGLGAALAFTAFLRLYLYLFTGRRQAKAEKSGASATSPAPPAVRVALWGLAALSAGSGFFPTALIMALTPLVQSIAPALKLIGDIVPPVFWQAAPDDLLPKLGGRLFHWLPLPGAVIQPVTGVASIAPTYVLFWFMLFAGLAWLAARGPGRPYRMRTAKAWLGGNTYYGPQSQYSATAYSNPHRMLFGSLGQFTVQRTIHEGTDNLPLRIGVQADMLQILSVRPYERFFRHWRRKFKMISKIQHGHLFGYVAYILGFILLLLLWVGLQH